MNFGNVGCLVGRILVGKRLDNRFQILKFTYFQSFLLESNLEDFTRAISAHVVK